MCGGGEGASLCQAFPAESVETGEMRIASFGRNRAFPIIADFKRFRTAARIQAKSYTSSYEHLRDAEISRITLNFEGEAKKNKQLDIEDTQ